MRLTPLGPMPRSDTPWVVGLATRLLLRRNRLNPGSGVTGRPPSGGRALDIIPGQYRHIGRDILERLLDRGLQR